MLTLVSMSCTLTTCNMKHGPKDEGCSKCHFSFGHSSRHSLLVDLSIWCSNLTRDATSAMSRVMFFWEKTQVLTIKEEWDPFARSLDSQSNMFLLICIERRISIPHNKIPGTETELASLASHQSFMPSRCNLSREATRGLVSREVCSSRKPSEGGCRVSVL